MLCVGLACNQGRALLAPHLPQGKKGHSRPRAGALHEEAAQSIIAAAGGHAAGPALARLPSGAHLLPHWARQVVFRGVVVPSCSALLLLENALPANGWTRGHAIPPCVVLAIRTSFQLA